MSESPTHETSGLSLRVVLITMAVIVVVAGVRGYQSFSASEVAIHAAFTEIHEAGATLSAEECVSAALAWHGECPAMNSLCDGSVPMMMGHCLQAQDRSAYCDALGREPETAQWTFKKCYAHGVDKHNKKACTNAYRAIDSYCQSGQKGVLL